MKYSSTREAAKKVGIPYTTLATYLSVGKVPPPKTEIAGITKTQIWTEEEIEDLRKLLPKIANGRKTRYKKQSAASTQQSVKTKAQARVPVPHKSRKPKKKKSNPKT
jgi:predicted site-specific integrase-resolvase